MTNHYSRGLRRPVLSVGLALVVWAGFPAAGLASGGSTAGELGGTSWRLVQIMSMDDSVYTPSDRSLFTLELATDGSMTLRADCNHGRGTWSSDSAGRLTFGPIAATRALCPPGSLHDRYLAQFEWVRSYVVRDGHLFLATLADGSILEFEPVVGHE